MVKVADFALARLASLPSRAYTTKVRRRAMIGASLHRVLTNKLCAVGGHPVVPCTGSNHGSQLHSRH